MDGTLLPETSGLLAIAKITDTEAQVLELELAFKQQLLDTIGFTEAIYNLWGELTPSEVQRAFEATPKLTELERTLSEIRTNGNISCLITMSQDIYANYFRSSGFDLIFATKYPCYGENLRLPDRVLTPADKPRIAAEVSKSNNTSLSLCVAFGDSLSDAPLFEKVGCAVSVNGDHHIQELAHTHYVGSSIYEAYCVAITKLETIGVEQL